MERSRSIRQILCCLGLAPAGGNYTQMAKYLRTFDIDISHLKGHAWNKGMRGTSRAGRPLEKVLADGIYTQSSTLKRRLISAGLKPAYCEECGWSMKTPDGYLPLEMHHINGNPMDNRLENLQILCPNCHALKPYYRGRKLKTRIGGAGVAEPGIRGGLKSLWPEKAMWVRLPPPAPSFRTGRPTLFPGPGFEYNDLKDLTVEREVRASSEVENDACSVVYIGL